MMVRSNSKLIKKANKLVIKKEPKASMNTSQLSADTSNENTNGNDTTPERMDANESDLVKSGFKNVHEFPAEEQQFEQ